MITEIKNKNLNLLLRCTCELIKQQNEICSHLQEFDKIYAIDYEKMNLDKRKLELDAMKNELLPKIDLYKALLKKSTSIDAEKFASFLCKKLTVKTGIKHIQSIIEINKDGIIFELLLVYPTKLSGSIYDLSNHEILCIRCMRKRTTSKQKMIRSICNYRYTFKNANKKTTFEKQQVSVNVLPYACIDFVDFNEYDYKNNKILQDYAEEYFEQVTKNIKINFSGLPDFARLNEIISVQNDYNYNISKILKDII